MENIRLVCHCNSLAANVISFINSINDYSFSNDRLKQKAEIKYMKKLNKQLNLLLNTLNNCPNK